jgi:hypothetical protein
MHTIQLHFQKSLLPQPREFYQKELGRLSRPNRKGWAQAACPFHASKSRTSFSVNLNSGAFRCFGCDAHGGDVLSFVRLRHGLGFKEAAISLGVWDATPSPESIRKIEAQDREHKKNKLADEQLKAERHRHLMALREQLLLAISFQREAENRLHELHAGADPISATEEDACWEIMSLSLDRERMLSDEYFALAGLDERYGD